MKICVVVASRANYGRIRSVLESISKSSKLELQLVVSASALLERFGNVSKLIEKDGFKIDRKAFYALEGNGHEVMAKSTGLGIVELSSVFRDLKPDYVLTVADRFETMATAIAATYMNIRLIHTQGGEITGSIDESVRHAITKMAHIHFTATDESMKRVIKMGENPKYVFNTGCPAMDALIDIQNDKHIELNGVGFSIDLNKKYNLIIYHPVTSDPREKIEREIDALINFSELISTQWIWLWPNIDAGSDYISKKLRIAREKGRLKNVFFSKNFEVEDYNFLLMKAEVLIGNSSSFIREGSFLGTKAIILGDRQQGREHDNNVLFISKVTLLSLKKAYSKILSKTDISKSKRFGDGKAAQKMIEILETIELPSIQKRNWY